MKRQRLQLVALQLVALQLVVLAVLALSCEPELSREEALAGKRCAGDADCVEGYLCRVDGICVSSSSLTGAAGSANGGNGNGPGTRGSSDGGSSAGGASGSGIENGGGAGSASAGSQGSAGSGSLGGAQPDAGSAPPDPPDASPAADGGCTPIRIFRDLDGDGFGRLREEDPVSACSVPAGFVTVGRDCFDGPTILSERAEDVHPGQTEFFAAGYHFDPSDISVVSFDYDCSGAEEHDPTNDPDIATDCSQVPVPCAAPEGFEPTERSGIGVDDVCGSEFTVTCIGAGATCIVGIRSNESQPFRCH